MMKYKKTALKIIANFLLQYGHERRREYHQWRKFESVYCRHDDYFDEDDDNDDDNNDDNDDDIDWLLQRRQYLF